MRDIFVVLADKEAQLKRLQSEIDLLRSAARLLTDGEEVANHTPVEPDKPFAVVTDASQRQARTAVSGMKQFP
jgi:hypothetical protein